MRVKFAVKSAMKLLKIAISKLDSREKYIMQLRFGIDGDEKEKTQKMK